MASYSIRTIVKEENQSLVESCDKRFAAVEARQEQLEHRIEELERKLGQIYWDVRSARTTDYYGSLVAWEGSELLLPGRGCMLHHGPRGRP